MKSSYRNLIPATIVFSLMGGLLVTAMGFYSLSSIQGGITDWRWTHQYLVIILLLMIIISLVGAWRGPNFATVIVGAVLAISLGATVPVVVLVLLSLSAFTLGRLVFRSSVLAPSDNLLVGIVVAGTLLSLLVQLPVNNAGTWGLLFSLPLLLGWRYIRVLWPRCIQCEPVGAHLYLLQCAIGSAVLLHFFVGLMPEIGHDALVMHLFLPAHIAQNQSWDFDAEHYVWAAAPMLVDWLYTAGYLFAGETGARLINFGSILLLAVMVNRIALWAGASRVSASWAMLILLVTPLTFLESSSLFIEGMWSAFVVGGTLALLRMFTRPEAVKTEVLLGGLLLGGALASKAVTFTVLPILAIVLVAVYRRWFKRSLLGTTAFALVIFLAIGAIPYARAFVITGNPVFPFFNAYFQSPLYAPVNFSPPAIFERGISWDTFYRMTFDSGKYLEATAGAAGFQWLLLIIPGTILLIITGQRRALVISLLMFTWIWLTFEQTAYLRYVFPSFVLGCALIGAVLAIVQENSGRAVWYITLGVAIITSLLNILHFNSAGWYGKIDFRAITDLREREQYIANTVPIRSAVNLVNDLNHELNPVAFFSASLAAGLKAKALFPSWYNIRFQNAVLASQNADELGGLLAREDVKYLILDDAENKKGYFPFVNDVSIEVSRIGPISVRKLRDIYSYTEELLSSTTFETDWHLSTGAIRLPDGSLQVTVTSSAYSVVPVQPGTKYRYSAEARCAAGPAIGRMQVNWLDAAGTITRSDIQVFDCTSKSTAYSMELLAPAKAAHALVYASGHEEKPIIFSKISFRD